MLKKTIQYKDFDGVDWQEDHYFNLSKSELAKLELSTEGGMEKKIKELTATNDGGAIMDFFEKIIKMAYGVRGKDARIFEKSPEISARFLNSAAYDTLFMELVTSPTAAAEFMNGLIVKSE